MLRETADEIARLAQLAGARAGVVITRRQLEEWAGPLTDAEVTRLAGCIPYSSIPQAVEVIVHDAIRDGQPGDGDETGEDGDRGWPPGLPVRRADATRGG